MRQRGPPAAPPMLDNSLGECEKVIKCALLLPDFRIRGRSRPRVFASGQRTALMTMSRPG